MLAGFSHCHKGVGGGSLSGMIFFFIRIEYIFIFFLFTNVLKHVSMMQFSN